MGDMSQSECAFLGLADEAWEGRRRRRRRRRREEP